MPLCIINLFQRNVLRVSRKLNPKQLYELEEGLVAEGFDTNSVFHLDSPCDQIRQ